jgi:hypothetical protein
MEELDAGDLADAHSIALIVRKPAIRVMVSPVVAVRRANNCAALDTGTLITPIDLHVVNEYFTNCLPGAGICGVSVTGE